MRKHLFSLGVALLLILCPTVASAQQTLEEATDSIKNVLALAKKAMPLHRMKLAAGTIVVAM